MLQARSGNFAKKKHAKKKQTSFCVYALVIQTDWHLNFSLSTFSGKKMGGGGGAK